MVSDVTEIELPARIDPVCRRRRSPGVDGSTTRSVARTAPTSCVWREA